ncbi:MAG TPA: hypothetical protein VE570_15855 [Thermoleophilaceae bacterium]|jgi:hypothetical protein|nr:hypothetical protein [Thermoleophilaceae bacterium]
MEHADFYEALVPRAASELGMLRQAEEPALARLQIESVTAERSAEHGPHIAVTFRDPERPGCLFGWRWSWTEDPRPAELEFAAQMLRVNLEEDVLSERYGLPADCAGGAVTWF